MNSRKIPSEFFHQQAKELVGELARMWQRSPARGRLDAFECVGKALGISSRKAKAVIYDEETLSPFQAPQIAAKAPSAWARLADQFLLLAEYCQARAELARTKAHQAELDFTLREVSCLDASYAKRAA